MCKRVWVQYWGGWRMTKQHSESGSAKANFRRFTRPHSEMSAILPSHTSVCAAPTLPGTHGELWALSFNLTPPPPPLPFPQCGAPGGPRVGRSSSPGRVRRELITFGRSFSPLCKEQSALISVHSRRMLIQCQTDSPSSDGRMSKANI